MSEEKFKPPSYPKVYAIGHRAIADLFTKGPVTVEEKVDGSQISFMTRLNEETGRSELIIRSRNSLVNPEDPGMFSKAVEAIRAVEDLLIPEVVYRGEYLRTEKHNTLKYDRIPKNHIILFDIMISMEYYLPSWLVAVESDKLGFESVPVIYEGNVHNIEQLKEFLKISSILGGVEIEGVVVKNREHFSTDGKFLVGKLVSEKFKERHEKSWKVRNPSQTNIVDGIIERLNNPNRWEKAVQHLRDNGNLEGSPRDIGNLIKEVQNDIYEEEQDFIKQILFNHFWKTISKGVIVGLPEWYKLVLAEGAFEDGSDIG